MRNTSHLLKAAFLFALTLALFPARAASIPDTTATDSLRQLRWTGDTAITVRLDTEVVPSPTLPDDYTGKPTFTSSDTAVAAVDSLGSVTLRAAGTDTITARCPADSTYHAAVLNYTLTVLPALKTLAFNDGHTTFNTLLEQVTFNGPTLPDDYTGIPSYMSSDDDVATVDSAGLVSLHQVGAVTITAQCPADSTYNAAELSYVLYVGASQGTSFYADSYIAYEGETESYPIQAQFTVLDAEQRTAVLGDNSSPAIDENADGTFSCPDIVTYNNVPYTVTAIGDFALSSCRYLWGVQLPKTVKWVGQSAFECCNTLSSIDLGGTESIGSAAFKQCNRLTGLTLPATVRHIATDAFSLNSLLRYIDARQCDSLQLASLRGDDSPFGPTISSEVIVYMPVGSPLTGLNAINTDTLGQMTCELMMIDSVAYSRKQCASGAATYRLNNKADSIIFGQRLGTNDYPIPSTLAALSVRRVRFYNGDTLRATLYANNYQPLNSLPDADTLHITTGTPAFFYYKQSQRIDFTADTQVTSDLTVYAYGQQPAGTAGHVLQGPVTIMDTQGNETSLQATYRITDPDQRTVQLGDGTYPALPTAYAGTLIIPASIMGEDSTLLQVTSIGHKALKGQNKLTSIVLGDSVQHIADGALSGCSKLISFTAPVALCRIGEDAFSGDRQLRYIDLRQAAGLTLNALSRKAGELNGISDTTIVYLPTSTANADTTLHNIVYTDSIGDTHCSHFVVDDKEFSPESCRNGAAAYALHLLYSDNVFGQRIGTDNYPLPLTDSAATVLRVQFVMDDTVISITRYVNYGSTLPVPTPAELGFTTTLAQFTAIIDGEEVSITDSTTIYTDLTVLCEPKSIAGEDGYLFTAPAECTTAENSTASVATTCRITSYAQRTAEVGDSRHSCITLTDNASLTVPDSVMLDSIAYAVTSIAPNAFKADEHLTLVNLPATITAIGDSAFARCSNLEHLTLPASVTSAGNAIVSGCGELSYIDMRAATALPSLTPDSGTLSQCPAEAILYLPVGHATVSATNVVCTDSAGNQTCKELWVDRLTLTGDDAANGRAAWMLNDWALREEFGQRIGTDPYPVPSTDSGAQAVRRIKVFDKNSLVASVYVNDGSVPTMPTAADMSLDPDTQFTFNTYQGGADGDTIVPFDNTAAVWGDTAVWLNWVDRGDINADGLIDIADITSLISCILKKQGSEKYEAACDLNGDGLIDISDNTELTNIILAQVTDSSAPEPLPTIPTQGPAAGDTTQRDLNVVVFGNSFSCDAYNYVPWVLFGVDPNVRLHMSLFIESGCNLQTHLSMIQNDDLYYLYYRYRGNFGRATYFYNIGWYKTSVSEQIDEYPLDLLLLQQSSKDVASFSSYKPYMKQIIHWVKHRNPSHIDVGFLLTPAYPDGSYELDNVIDGQHLTSDEMFMRQARVMRQLMTSENIDFVMPAGTAIQNARTTDLDTLGTFGHLSSDRMHLQDGAPCLAESYVVAETLLRHMGRKASIWDETSVLPISETWCVPRGMPQTAYPVVGLESGNITLTKLSVKAALDAPFQITDLSSTKSDSNE